MIMTDVKIFYALYIEKTNEFLFMSKTEDQMNRKVARSLAQRYGTRTYKEARSLPIDSYGDGAQKVEVRIKPLGL
jgi:hypothetical protein